MISVTSDPFQAILERKWGPGVRIRRERFSDLSGARTVSVATTATRILPPNPNRIAWQITNQDTTNTVKFDNTGDVSASSGFPLGPSQTARSDFELDGQDVQDAVHGIASGGAVTVHRAAWEVY